MEGERRDREFAKQKEEREEDLKIQREALRLEAIKVEAIRQASGANVASLKTAIEKLEVNTAAIAEIRTELATVKDECAQAKSVGEGAF